MTPFNYQKLSGRIDTKTFTLIASEDFGAKTHLDNQARSLGALSASSQPPQLLTEDSPHPAQAAGTHTHPESRKCLGIMSPGAALTSA